MPYRVDLSAAPPDALDRLVRLGALDVEIVGDGLAALLPDIVLPAALPRELEVPADAMRISPAKGRDEGSVWRLTPQPVRVGRVAILPSHLPSAPGAIRLRDGSAFGTGLHPTTALCLDVLQQELAVAAPAALLDVGVGSGILALAALMLGVPAATGVDVDDAALKEAEDNARLNGLHDRLELVHGGPEAVDGAWPLVLANVLASPLIEMAPVLVRRVGTGGILVLSGIQTSVVDEVVRAYRHVGMRALRAESRDAWAAVVLGPLW